MAYKHSSSRFALREIPLFVALVCGATVTSYAQTPALRDVVVSGTRSEQDRDDLPVSTEVINAQDIEKRQIGDIRDVAAELPNVSVARSAARFTIGSQSGRDQNAGFNIRGLDGNRVLMLVDGIRQPRGYFFQSESSVGRDYIDIGLVKRVEILKGATSALYGSDGVAGLVNFITREPSDYLAGGKTFGGSASVGYNGDRDGYSTGATIAGRASDALEWLVSAGVTGSRGLKNKGQNDSANTDRTTPNPETDSGKSLLAKLVFTPGAGQKHILSYEHIEKTADYNLLSNIAKPPLAGTSTVSSNANTSMKRDRLTWDGRFQINNALADDIRTVLSFQNAASNEYFFQGRLTPPDRIRNTYYNERTLQANLQANKLLRMSPDAVQKITYGVDYTQTDIRNLQTGQTPPAGETYPLKRFPDTRESSSAIYAQDEFVMGRVSVTPGVRVDSFSIKASQNGFVPAVASISGSAVSPKLGAVFRATPEWSLYGNYAAGFKAPNASQINAFFENPGPQAFYRTIANPNLKPEKSQNFEIGTRGRMSNVSIDVAAFAGRYKDFIEDSVAISGGGTAGNPTVFQSVNLSNVRISGFEVKGRVEAGRVGTGDLSFPFAYGQTKGTNNATGKPVDSIQPAKLNIGVDYATPVWSAGLHVTQYAGKKFGDIGTQVIANNPPTPNGRQVTTDSATTLDLMGQWKINKGLRLNAGIYNLTDKKYTLWSSVIGQQTSSTTLDAYTQPGRYMRVSMVMDF